MSLLLIIILPIWALYITGVSKGFQKDWMNRGLNHILWSRSHKHKPNTKVRCFTPDWVLCKITAQQREHGSLVWNRRKHPFSFSWKVSMLFLPNPGLGCGSLLTSPAWVGVPRSPEDPARLHADCPQYFHSGMGPLYLRKPQEFAIIIPNGKYNSSPMMSSKSVNQSSQSRCEVCTLPGQGALLHHRPTPQSSFSASEYGSF